MTKKIKKIPKTLAASLKQVQQRKMLELMTEIPHRLSLQFQSSHYGITINDNLYCMACGQNKVFDTVEKVRQHCASYLHKQCMQLHMLRQRYANLAQKYKDLEQAYNKLKGLKLIDNKLQLEDNQISTDLQSCNYIKKIDEQNVIKTAHDTQQIAKRIETQSQHLDEQNENSNEVDETIDNFDDFDATNQKTLKAKPWTEIRELKQIAKCQHITSLKLRLEKEIKNSFIGQQSDTWFKHYKYLLRKLLEVLHSNRSKSILDLLCDFVGSHVSQLTKAKAIVGKFASTFNIKIDKNTMKQKIKKQIRDFKTNKEEMHQFWSNGQLQQIYEAFYCCHPYTRLFYYFVLTTGCRGEDMFRVKLKEFEDSVQDDEQARKPLKLIDGKVFHLKWDRLVWWPEKVRQQMKQDSALLGERLFLFGPQNGHDKFRDKVIRLLDSHILHQHPNVQILHLSRFHSFRTTAYNLLSQSTSETKNLSEKIVNQYFGWESQGVQQKYTRSLQVKTLKQIADEIEREFTFPLTSTDSCSEYTVQLQQNIDKYVRKFMIRN